MFAHPADDLVIQFDKRGQLRKRLVHIACIERRDTKKIGFGIAGKKPFLPVDKTPASRRHHPPVELVTVGQALVAVVLRHLKLVQPPRQEARRQKHAASKQESAPPSDAPVFLLLDLLAHDETLIRLNAMLTVVKIT